MDPFTIEYINVLTQAQASEKQLYKSQEAGVKRKPVWHTWRNILKEGKEKNVSKENEATEEVKRGRD